MKFPEKRQAAADLLGLSTPLTLSQVHGTTIHDGEIENAGLDGDGWLLSRRDLTVGVYVADCVPLFLLGGGREGGRRVSRRLARHGEGMALAAVAAFRDRLGVPASQLSAATGPHIGACCYKVGPEFVKDFPESSLSRRDGDLYLDLAAETRRQLTEAGLSPEKIACQHRAPRRIPTTSSPIGETSTMAVCSPFFR